jgi:zinc transporter ZupT
MNDPKILVLISKHIEGKESEEERTEFAGWLKEDKNNQIVYSKIKNTWLGIEELPTPFFKKFNRKYMTNVVIQKTLGNLVGFAVGVLITNSFTHYVTERRSVKNLFGLAGRKKVLVNDTPEWIQYGLSILLGFIVVEMINHFFGSKKHILIWKYIKEKIHKN